MITIQNRKEDECEDCYQTKVVFETSINGKPKKLLCERCRDKKINKWFDAKEANGAPRSS